LRSVKQLIFLLALSGCILSGALACTPRVMAVEASKAAANQPAPPNSDQASVADPSATPVDSRSLVFDEEFDGGLIDSTMWQTQYWWGRTNPPELQYYTPNAFEFPNGHLRIKADRQKAGGKQFTSGILTTYDKLAFTFARIEIRARIPSGKGLWPALWLLANNRDSKSEIDIMEVLGDNPRKLYATLTPNGAAGGPRQIQGTFAGPDLSSDFHVYALDWKASSITWYVDGQQVFRVTQDVPHEPMYLIINLAVGGDWPGNPDSKTKFPAYFDIDYVRIYR
jgi:beta-glucanase (GH16 family)